MSHASPSSTFTRTLLGLLTGLLVLSMSVPAAAAEPAARLLISTNADRSDAAPLEGSALDGAPHIFVETPKSLDRVRFTVATADGRVLHDHTERKAPYDLASTRSSGGARALDVSDWIDGTYAVTAEVRYGDGTAEALRGSLTLGAIRATAGKDDLSLLVSERADRSNAEPLEATATSGLDALYVFAVSQQPARSIAFTLDDASEPMRVERRAPYDLMADTNGAANPLELEDLSPGEHTITAVATHTDGSQSTGEGSFTVAANNDLDVPVEETAEQAEPPASEGKPTDAPLVSDRAERTDPRTLNGATVPSTSYLRHPYTSDDVREARFWLDTERNVRGSWVAPFRRDDSAPYDANLVNLQPGEHYLITAMVMDDGSYHYDRSTFTVEGADPDTVVEEQGDPSGPTPSRDGNKVLGVNFDASPLGRYSESSAKKDWGPGLRGFNHKRGEARIVSDKGNRFLSVMQPRNTYGQAPTWHVQLGKHYDHALLEYDVKFGRGFEFGKLGGKLPGLQGIRDGLTKNACSSRDGTDSFSARLMWKYRERNRDSQGGQFQAYTYHPAKSSGCGDSERFSSHLTDDRWYHVEIEVRMNTPSVKNGQMIVRLDGKELYPPHELRVAAPVPGRAGLRHQPGSGELILRRREGRRVGTQPRRVHLLRQLPADVALATTSRRGPVPGQGQGPRPVCALRRGPPRLPPASVPRRFRG